MLRQYSKHIAPVSAADHQAFGEPLRRVIVPLLDIVVAMALVPPMKSVAIELGILVAAIGSGALFSLVSAVLALVISPMSQ